VHYYERCVIGGPDSFVIGIEDIAQFDVAIRRKLVREIAGMFNASARVSYRSPVGQIADCYAFGYAPGR
jgi:hypothetical protein